MEEITKVELKTTAEWAEQAGLIINDYDGFLKAYKQLAAIQDETTSPSEHIMRRTIIIPEYILCTRQAFDKALMLCSMTTPRNMDYSIVSETAPNYCEKSIGRRLYGIIFLLEDIKRTGDVPSDSLYTKDELLVELQRLIESYEVAIANNMKLNNIEEERPISEITDSIHVKGKRIVQSAAKDGETVEGLEQELIDELKKSIQEVIDGKKAISTISIDQIQTLCALQNVSVRAERHRDVVIEDQSYKNPNYGKTTEPMKMQTYRIIDENGAHHIVSGMQGDVIVSTETDAKTYESVRAKKEKTTMKTVVTSAVEDCTPRDVEEAIAIEMKEQDEKTHESQSNPEEGEL